MELNRIMKIIDEKRTILGMSKKEMAEKADVTYRAILLWESGKRGITLDNLVRLIDAVDMKLVIKNKNS